MVEGNGGAAQPEHAGEGHHRGVLHDQQHLLKERLLLQLVHLPLHQDVLGADLADDEGGADDGAEVELAAAQPDVEEEEELDAGLVVALRGRSLQGELFHLQGVHNKVLTLKKIQNKNMVEVFQEKSLTSGVSTIKFSPSKYKNTKYKIQNENMAEVFKENFLTSGVSTIKFSLSKYKMQNVIYG